MASGRARNSSYSLSILVYEFIVVNEDELYRKLHLDRQLDSRNPGPVEVRADSLKLVRFKLL